jgi:L-2-hydroxyglutarate oxidase
VCTSRSSSKAQGSRTLALRDSLRESEPFVRTVIVGGGILGLAAARLILEDTPQAEILVLEKERDVAQHQTGHNSGVAHAGLYYLPGSLKARLCRRGVGLLQAYCRAHGIGYEECGKLLVATNTRELLRLDDVVERAEANAVPGVRRLTADGLRELEPHAVGLGGLYSPTTAIVDFVGVARQFAADIRDAGGVVRLGVEVSGVRDDVARPEVLLRDGTIEVADRVLVCAGLYSDRIARASGRSPDPRIIPFRGEFYALRPERAHLVRGLIYPVPDPHLPFLGVHLTRTVHGSVLVGPNAVLALSREGYRRRTVNARDVRDTIGWSGMRRVAVKHWRVGTAEIARSASSRVFLRAIRRYVPELRAADVRRAPAGVRAQAVSASGALVDDFVLDHGRNVMWVRNAPSPAATSSMAIAEELVEQLRT